jgi:hypothetical protein
LTGGGKTNGRPMVGRPDKTNLAVLWAGRVNNGTSAGNVDNKNIKSGLYILFVKIINVQLNFFGVCSVLENFRLHHPCTSGTMYCMSSTADILYVYRTNCILCTFWFILHYLAFLALPAYPAPPGVSLLPKYPQLGISCNHLLLPPAIYVYYQLLYIYEYTTSCTYKYITLSAIYDYTTSCICTLSSIYDYITSYIGTLSAIYDYTTSCILVCMYIISYI